MFHITLGAVLRFEEAVEFVAPDPVNLVFVVCSDGDSVVVRWIDRLHSDEANTTIFVDPVHFVAFFVLHSRIHFDHCLFGNLQWLIEANGAAGSLHASRWAAVVPHFRVNEVSRYCIYREIGYFGY